MVREKTKFSDDFKKDAVALGEKLGVQEAAKSLGINPIYLRRWSRIEDKNSDKKNDFSVEELIRKNRQLEKENGYLRKINDVLKKSTAILSRDHLEYF